MLSRMVPSSPPAMRTFHLLKTPDILCANDNRLLVNYQLVNRLISTDGLATDGLATILPLCLYGRVGDHSTGTAKIRERASVLPVYSSPDRTNWWLVFFVKIATAGGGNFSQ